MNVYASTFLFSRGGRPTFRRPRKETQHNETQARKAASRYWLGAIGEDDKPIKVVLAHVIGGVLHVAERSPSARTDKPWQTYRLPIGEVKEAHLVACLTELGVDPSDAPPPVPDVLEINGVIYRRDI